MQVRQFDARSPDGTSIAVFVGGEGPPLVLVPGAMSDHRNDAPFIAELTRSFTVCAMDRCGRGASGDHDEYSIEREFEDVAAVVDAVANRVGGPVAVWGHSFGADCAMGAAPLTPNIHRLILYEPGLGMAYPAGSVEAVRTALAAGDHEAATVAVMAKVVEMTNEEVEYIRSLDTWAARVALVSTVPRELAAESGWVYRSGWLDRVTAPTLLLAGRASPDAQTSATRRAAAALPNSDILVLDGHGHIAHRTDPAMVAEIVTGFVTGGPSDRGSSGM
jgi:pimeloyl-ACP methyl ester carboxylesterase